MDSRIAIIAPSTEITTATKRIMEQSGRDYPCCTLYGNEAADLAKKLTEHGLLVVISQGATCEFIKKYVPSVIVMELAFAGLDALNMVQKALSYGKKTVYVGAKQMYFQMQRSLVALNEPLDRVAFCETTLESDIEATVNSLVAQGYGVFISGHLTTIYAQNANCIAMEHCVDDAVIERALVNAESTIATILREKEYAERSQAILDAASDGMIVLDEDHRIVNMNPATLRIFQNTSNELIGKPMEEALLENGLVDVSTISSATALSPQMTPVFLRKTPLIIHDQKRGSVVAIKTVSEIQKLDSKAKQALTKKGLTAKHTFQSISGESAAIRQVKNQAFTYAKYNSSVLITGETGTGKELFAQSIHNASLRKDAPFVAVNCAALPETLIESELFGYEKGAFTGANKDGKRGLFEIANKGTLFLDEISEISLSTQAKLLRAIQEKEIIRVGGNEVIPIDIRIICSSNKNLLNLVREGQFKEDLYYRLSVLPIKIPPLRERQEDIKFLSQALLKEYADKHMKNISALSPQVIQILSSLPLRGNVRELRNIIERLVILNTGDEIIGLDVLETCGLYENIGEAPPTSTFNIRDAEAEMILSALEQCGGNKSATAKLLGISTATLWRKLKAYQTPQ